MELAALPRVTSREAPRSRDKLRQSIRGQLVSDVPIGAFLSGGIDSSLTCAIMQEQSPSKINTYTIGFHEPEYDEAPFARKVAEHLGTNHSEYYVSARDALALVEKLIPHIRRAVCRLIPTAYLTAVRDGGQECESSAVR